LVWAPLREFLIFELRFLIRDGEFTIYAMRVVEDLFLAQKRRGEKKRIESVKWEDSRFQSGYSRSCFAS
jgi:hypothetical protein